jgi:predicted nucleotide-binding protein (sugar kinase/HSP70/actin superfamily)
MARIRGKRLWLPFMSGVSHVLAAVLRAHGIDAQVLPQSPDTSLGLARTYVVGDVCIPMLYTTEDMLYRAVQADFNPEKESFFQGKSGGPCRYGFYYMIEKFILDRLKGPVDFVTLSHSSNDGGLGALFTLMGWDCIVAHDMLEKLLLHTRPYETVRGESQALFHRYLDELCRLAERSQRNLSSKRATFSALCGTHLGEVANLLASAAKDFEAIPGTKELRPLVGVVGEFFVRAHEPSNRYLVRTLESLGAEVWIAPSSEFLGYFNYITGVRDFERFSETGRFRHYLEGIARTLIGHVAMRDEKILFTSCGSYIRDFHEISPKEMVEMGKKYINYFFGGEAICSMGKSEDFASRELAGIVSAGPFNCMPSLVVSALSRELRARHGNIPFLNLDFDGFEDNTRDQRITTFMAQVRQRHSLKRGVLS